MSAAPITRPSALATPLIVTAGAAATAPTPITAAPPPAKLVTAPTTAPPVAAVGWLELRVLAEVLEDTMSARIAARNRVGSGGVDGDLYAAGLDALDRAEAEVRKALTRHFQVVVPAGIRAWQAASTGIGVSTLARLLGVIGDPRIAYPSHWEGTGTKRRLVSDDAYYRNPAKLWAYCGHGDPARRRTRGMTADEAFALGNPRAKMLTYLLAVACLKAVGDDPEQHELQARWRPAKDDPAEPTTATEPTDPPALLDDDDPADTASGGPTPTPGAPCRPASPYRLVYDRARVRYVEAEHVHAAPCVRCGPAGKPAEAGSPTSDAHRHGMAMRLVGKTILLDLWRAAE